MLDRLNRRGVPPQQQSNMNSSGSVSQHQHHPPGAPRPGPDAVHLVDSGAGGSGNPGLPKSIGSSTGPGRLQPRPAPPSYQQVCHQSNQYFTHR
ncbi:unnamed protein product [Echinostoma caproni]|uniref:Ecdysone-induced protein 74EF n=1 Tax=Echinostoma caproni TaxID=27848 RepID=A0A183BCU7_9TREM|nr:unnamed protein product [Echinostoma caproni]